MPKTQAGPMFGSLAVIDDGNWYEHDKSYELCFYIDLSLIKGETLY